jgi:hypothetical protein
VIVWSRSEVAGTTDPGARLPLRAGAHGRQSPRDHRYHRRKRPHHRRGSKVLFTDEWGGGAQPRSRETDPIRWGADASFAVNNGKLTLASYYKMPAPQSDTENCVAHNGSLVPIPGREVFVQA